MPNTATSPYFLAGIAAVACFFLSGALVGFSLFSVGASRARLLRILGWLLLLMVAALAWLGVELLNDLRGPDGLTAVIEPDTNALADWTRRTLSVLIFALSTVFASLMTAFGSIRGGRAGEAFRALPWAVVGAKVVLASAAVMALLGQASLDPSAEDAIAPGDLADVARPLLDSTVAVFGWLGPAALVWVLLSFVFSWWLRRQPKPADAV